MNYLHYISYFFRAQNEHAIHAPFLYNFYLKVIKNRQQNADFEAIEAIRSKLLNDETPISKFDFGAGTRTRIKTKSLKNIAATSLSSQKKARLLFNIVRYLKCETIIEIGSSLGISTAYLASANKNASVYSLEGNLDLIRLAKKTALQLNLTNIKFIDGNFDDTLPRLLQTLNSKIDFVYLDGNHRFSPTLRYFEMLLPNLHQNSILVVDDIYWSEEMTQAWQKIINRTGVTLTVNLFECGMVFFSDKYSKRNFTLKF